MSEAVQLRLLFNKKKLKNSLEINCVTVIAHIHLFNIYEYDYYYYTIFILEISLRFSIFSDFADGATHSIPSNRNNQ